MSRVNTGATAVAGASLPAGIVLAVAATGAPTGDFLECDGSAVSRTTYADLYTATGDRYGNGDGSTTFNLPDYRGQFLRGFDDGAGIDPDAASRTDSGDGTTGDNIGTQQADAFDSHTHGVAGGSFNAASGSGQRVPGNHASTQLSAAVGGNETRPVNIAVAYYITF